MLKYIDDHGILPRIPNGPTPCILLDGHSSRLELPFLKYINQPERKWKALIGIPYGTSLWQVGDSVEQNGCFKMHQYDYKVQLVNKKRELNMNNTNLNKSVVIPIVNYCWDRSFARVDTNRKAITQRGWNPLNYALLDSPNLHGNQPQTHFRPVQPPNQMPDVPLNIDCTQESELSTLSSSPTPDLNFRNGFAGNCILDLLQQAQKDKHFIANLEKRKDSNRSLKEELNHAKRITAGVLFNAGEVDLAKPEIFEAVYERTKAKEREAIEKASKELERYKKRLIKAKTLLQRKQQSNTNLSNLNSDEMNIEDLKTMIMVRKKKKDKGLPKSLSELKEMWERVKHNSELTYEEHLRDQQYDEQVISIVLDNQNKTNSPSTTVTPMELDAALSIVGLSGGAPEQEMPVAFM